MWDQIVKFGRYSFNKAHSACYSYIAYLTAWAKYHYPAEFMAALIGSVTSEPEQTAIYIADCKRMLAAASRVVIGRTPQSLAVPVTRVAGGGELTQVRRDSLGRSESSHCANSRNGSAEGPSGRNASSACAYSRSSRSRVASAPMATG